MALKPEKKQVALFTAIKQVVGFVTRNYAVEPVSLRAGPVVAWHLDGVSPVVASAEKIAVVELGSA
jgi:hypothetical protein